MQFQDFNFWRDERQNIWFDIFICLHLQRGLSSFNILILLAERLMKSACPFLRSLLSHTRIVKCFDTSLLLVQKLIESAYSFSCLTILQFCRCNSITGDSCDLEFIDISSLLVLEIRMKQNIKLSNCSRELKNEDSYYFRGFADTYVFTIYITTIYDCFYYHAVTRWE